ncbi:hypothetical protein [Pseudomonas bohemica]|uniref:hypothetical protein n=1 Tax=Pseudomonas bohemica TaxID=2044872 RepID=UPI000DA5FF2D|nr:hypothetical protein [Pseudomonas bohemica]
MLIFRQWATLFATMLMLMIDVAHAENRPQVADKVIAYKGQQGIKVWTLRIGERSDNQALVQLEDVDHEWNMRIQKMTVAKSSQDTRYFTTVDGKKFVVLILQEGWGELYLPGEAKALQVSYDEDLSSQGDAQAFLTEYLQRQ